MFDLNISNILHQYKKKYNDAYEIVNKLDKLTQDKLHSLELDELTYHEKARIAIELSDIRKDRRHYKDIVDVFQPLIDIEGNNNLKVSSLAPVFSKVAVRYETLKNRKYRPKIKDLILNNDFV